MNINVSPNFLSVLSHNAPWYTYCSEYISDIQDLPSFSLKLTDILSVRNIKVSQIKSLFRDVLQDRTLTTSATSL